MNIIVLIVVGVVIYFLCTTRVGYLICDSNDVSCAAWSNKDVLSKCDSFCKSELKDGISFSHSQKYTVNPDGSVDCNCVASTVLNNIGTPSINVPSVKRSELPLRAGEVPSLEKLTNTADSSYDVNKAEQYNRFKQLIFG